MEYPGDDAAPGDVALWMAGTARDRYGLPGILPVMASCVEITSAWTSEAPGNVHDVVGYDDPVDGCSVGYFQQQADDLGCGTFGWGTRDELVEAPFALKRFLEEASKYKGQYSYVNPDELGQWCQAVQRSAYPDRYTERGYPMATELLKGEKKDETKVVTGQDIVNSCKKLLGAPYRFWVGGPLPMWLYDGQGNLPSADYLVNGPGVMCADLVSWAMTDNGLTTAFGTEAFADFLVDTSNFDPSTPGEVGAIAYAPYQGTELASQGHIAVFLEDGQTLIQALTFNGAIKPGTTMAYDQTTTYNWGGDTEFTTYGFLPGVSYGSGSEPEPAPQTEPQPEPNSTGRAWWDHGQGWYEVFPDWHQEWRKS